MITFSAICTPKNAFHSELLYMKQKITYALLEQGSYGLCLSDGAEKPYPPCSSCSTITDKKEVKTMTKKQKTAALLGRMAAAPALFLLMLGAGSLTAHAAGYDLYIGSTQVTDANAGDIFGDGTASYDAAQRP